MPRVMPRQSQRDEIQAELERILASQTFRKARRSGDLLRFLVTQSLAGNESDLKETVIGTQVFGRNASYDPTRDSVVRTAASRLRQRLATYFETEGLDSSWLISLPEEGYVPRITRRCAATNVCADDQADVPLRPPPISAAEAIDGRVGIPESRQLLFFRWQHAVVFIGMVVVLAAVLGSFSSTRTEAHVLAYHQLSNDGRPKSEPVFTNGSSVFFFETVKVGNGLGERLASVPVAGDHDPQLLSMPGATPCLVDHVAGDEFLIRLDGRGPVGPYHVWNLSTGALRPVPAKGSCFAAISPDGRFIASSEADRVVITDCRDGQERIIGKSPARYPRWSADGRLLRFVVHNFPSNTSAVWQCNYDGSGLQMVIGEDYGQIADDPDWTPDNRLFLFRRHSDERDDLWARVELPTPFQRKASPLTEGPFKIQGFRAAPDSSKLYAIGESARGELVRFDPKTREATPFLDGVSAIDLNFSRDAQWVAYQRFPEHTLWKSRVDGTAAIQLTPRGLEVFQPHWSPDGTRIAFMGHKVGGLFQIYTINADGTELRTAKSDDHFDQGVPTWSGDGDQIVFGELRLRRPDSEMEIHVIDLATKHESTIPGSRGKWSPRWSPDGRSIVAQTTDFTALDLFDVRSQSWHTLAAGLHQVDDPTWSADSQFVYFRCATGTIPIQQMIGRIRLSGSSPEILSSEVSMPLRHDLWFTITPQNDILLLRSVRIQEIYALDLTWR